MDFNLYAYQISPGSDEKLYFSSTFKECQQAALEQRQELREDYARDEVDEQIGAMAVYRCVIRIPERESLINVLNGEIGLLEAFIVEKTLVGLVAE